MDPNEALRLIRLTIAQMRVEDTPVGERGTSPTFVQHARDLAETVEGLDGWLSRDGVLPADWQSDDEKEQAATSLCGGVGNPMANKRPLDSNWVLGECPSCGKLVRNSSGITPQHTPSLCTVEHGDWTGPHRRIGSCP